MEDRHVAVLLEDIRSNFRAFGEALEGTRESLGRRIDELTRETRENSKFLLEYISRVDEHQKKLEETIHRMDARQERFEETVRSIDRTNQRIDKTNQQLAEIIAR